MVLGQLHDRLKHHFETVRLREEQQSINDFDDFANRNPEELAQEQIAESLWGPRDEGLYSTWDQANQLLLISRNKYREVHDIMIEKIGQISEDENNFIEMIVSSEHTHGPDWCRHNIEKIIRNKMRRRDAYIHVLLIDHMIGIPEIMVGYRLETFGVNTPPRENLEVMMDFYNKITRDLENLMELYNAKLDRIVHFIENGHLGIIRKIKTYMLLSEEITRFIVEPLETKS